MMRKRPYRKPEFPSSAWTTEQDCYLIEHSLAPLSELIEKLPFNEEEIQQRKEILGLIRRSKQLRKFI